MARQLEITEADLMHTVFPHPTLSEMMHESVPDLRRGRCFTRSTKAPKARPQRTGWASIVTTLSSDAVDEYAVELAISSGNRSVRNYLA